MVKKAGDTKIYWLQNGKLYHVLNSPILDAMKTLPGWDLWPNDVIQLTADEFSQYISEGLPNFISSPGLGTGSIGSNGLLISLAGNETPEQQKIYVMENGQRRHVVSVPVFEQCGYNFDDVVEVTKQIFDSIPEGLSKTECALVISINPTTGTVGVTIMTLEGSGFTPDGTATSTTTLPDGTVRNFPRNIDETGSFMVTFVLDQVGTYTNYETDDITGRQSNTITYTGIILATVSTMDFEDGTDGAVIRSRIEGLTFTTTQGFDWIYGDVRTGRYNVRTAPDSGPWATNGNFFAWLGPNQGLGRIDFTGATAKSVSFAYSSLATLHLEAFDSNGMPIDEDSGPGNLSTGRLDRLSVSGADISYVLVHDAGNFWLVDDLIVEDLLRETTARFLPQDFQRFLETLDTINIGLPKQILFANNILQNLRIILNWAGSEMKLEVYKPDGTLYAQQQSSTPPIIIDTPTAEAGTWKFIVTAIDIPSSDYPFALVVGTRPAPPEVLTDVTAMIQLDKSSSRFDRRTGQFSMMATLTNISADSLSEVQLVIENITPDTVTAANEDGMTSDGKPYHDYSNLLNGDGKLTPGEASGAKQLAFNNPSRVRFEFDVSVFGKVDGGGGAAPPSRPIRSLIGQPRRIHIIIPGISSLAQNYPNPFNPETWIPYELAEDSHVTIFIYGAQGRLVRTLNIGHREVGLYLSKEKAAYWDGRNLVNERVSSGVYFYQIQAGDFQSTKKMVILK